ncbi:MAG: hypothetical protein QM758_14795 [Armatimonas sp.]
MMITPTKSIKDLPEQIILEDCIDIFEERIYGWHLHVAKQMLKTMTQGEETISDRTIPHSEYAVLQVVMSFFETIAKYYDGFDKTGSSRLYFRRGIRICFGSSEVPEGETADHILDCLYDRVRNPLYHATSAVGIEFSLAPWVVVGLVEGRNEIIINIDNFVDILVQHLRNYCKRLRNPGEIELRAKFLRRFEFDMKAPEAIP